ncbi:hypothetical protein PSE_3840 [Pseudovibrio sp. FO-BEG1]|uniref:Uncharacterized protein n=1 Tax=Pseudovibrio denitrificans TaxID=258256 RepID=A0A1I6ZZE7_9HYPH|nr:MULTISPECIES: hypothetical protein [Pseudovibrio]AEV38344.1 hypothetical protein PSE_3840 [Pseudovibrio sp. FO-BEG1]EEA95517.1 conserved hypothetical protein [Pseudovibrio sp. JE062]SFT68052.1 hypothetical protein SAMN05444141_102740 [Pseudovibrio denitrificans]
MKKIALTLSVLGLVSAASIAQAALVNTGDLTASEAKALVQDKGAIVLSTGPGLYDRYVANASYCATHEETERAYVVTKDSNHSLIGYTCVVDNKNS